MYRALQPVGYENLERPGRGIRPITFFMIAILLFIGLVSQVSEAAPVPKRVALILINFQNDGTQPYTTSYANSILFNTINSFYRENSYGKFTLSGSVLGWYTIPYDNNSCKYNEWALAANDIARNSGADLGQYDYFIYAFPRTSSCTWTGLSQIGGTKSWNNGRLTLGVAGHEFAHDLGIQHSNAYRCYINGIRVAIGGSCTSYEYTDPFDIMGSGTFSTDHAGHMNSFHKGSMGWLESSNTLTVANSGVYTIAPVEMQTTGVQSLRIPRTKVNGVVTEYYYLEYRQPSGFDNYWRFSPGSPAVSGVTIRMAPDYALFTRTNLIDTIPSTLTFEDAPLTVGNTFTDSEKGITITTVSATQNGATISVAIGSQLPQPPPPGGCIRKNPALAMTKSGSLLVDGTQKYSITVRNNDAADCGASTFSVTPTLPPGFTQSPAWVSVNSLMPGSSSTFTVSVKSVLTGTYTLSVKAANNAAPGFTASVQVSYVR